LTPTLSLYLRTLAGGRSESRSSVCSRVVRSVQSRLCFSQSRDSSCAARLLPWATSRAVLSFHFISIDMQTKVLANRRPRLGSQHLGPCRCLHVADSRRTRNSNSPEASASLARSAPQGQESTRQRPLLSRKVKEERDLLGPAEGVCRRRQTGAAASPLAGAGPPSLVLRESTAKSEILHLPAVGEKGVVTLLARVA